MANKLSSIQRAKPSARQIIRTFLFTLLAVLAGGLGWLYFNTAPVSENKVVIVITPTFQSQMADEPMQVQMTNTAVVAETPLGSTPESLSPETAVLTEVVDTVNPAIVDESKWFWTHNVPAIEIAGECYRNPQRWDVLTKTGKFKTCAWQVGDPDLTKVTEIPPVMAVLPKGDSLPEADPELTGQYYQENLGNLPAVPENHSRVCLLRQTVQEKKGRVVTYWVLVDPTEDQLSEKIGGCYTVLAEEELVTVKVMIQMVNAELIGSPLSPVYLDSRYSGGWFGEHSYQAVP